MLASPPARADVSSWHFTNGAFRTQKDAGGNLLEVRPTKNSFAYVPDASNDKGILVLMMPGTGADVDGFQRYMVEAARQGYWVVGIDYINDHSGWELCTCNPDCNTRAISQTIEGTVPPHTFYDKYLGGDSTKIEYNSIHHRLYDFLNYLETTTSKHWLQFWASGNKASGHPIWSKMIAAGHSQGGALAIWLAAHRDNLLKAISLSSPISYLNIANSCQVNAENVASCPVSGAGQDDPGSSNAPAPKGPAFQDRCSPATQSPNGFAPNATTKWQDKVRIFACANDPGYDGSVNPGKNIKANATNLGFTAESVTKSSSATLGATVHQFLVMPDGEYALNLTGAPCSNPHLSTAFTCGPTWIETVWDQQLAH